MKTKLKWKNMKWGKKWKRENTKRNEQANKPLRLLNSRGCTANVSCATEAFKHVAKRLSAFPSSHVPTQLSVGLRNVCHICHGPWLSQVQPWNTGYVTKISIPVSSFSALALDLVSASASPAYTEHIFSVSSDVTARKRNRTQASLECRVFWSQT